MYNNTLSALILDDHAIVRQACRELLEKENISIAWEGNDPDDAYKNYVLLNPDLAIIDLSLKGMSGMETIRHIRNYNERSKIIVFSMYTDFPFISQAFQLGVLSYISKYTSTDEFRFAVKTVLDGKRYISSDLRPVFDKHGFNDKLPAITPQENKILLMITEGNSTTSIANALNISNKSVLFHLNSIKEKVGAKTISDLVRFSLILNLSSESR
ncbi:MAG: response regulator transcription factor [Thiotrichales bacterium]|nr:response regulator transcription factor [Thiotrichales bacterium]